MGCWTPLEKSNLDYVSLLPQFLQYLASVGFSVPHDTHDAEVSSAPHLMQCFAPAMSGALHLEHLPMFADSSGSLGGPNALGENTSDRITTSPTVAIFSCPSSNSRGKSLSSSRVLNCSLSMDRTNDLISPASFEMAFRTLPTIIPWESITCRPLRASIVAWASLMSVGSVGRSAYFSQA